jgi:ATP-binding cassette subfamily B protein
MERIKQFAKWTKGARLLFLITILFLFINTYFDTIVPLLITHLIDSVLGSEVSPLPTIVANWLIGETIKENILRIAIAYLIFSFFRGIFIFLRRAVNANFTEKIGYNMRNKIYKHLQNLSYSYYSSAETGDLIQRCTTDVETYKVFVSEQLIQILRVSSLVTFTILQMLNFNIKLTLISLITAPIIFVTSTIYFKYVKKIFKDVEEEEAKMTSTLQENLTGIRVVKAFAKEKYELKKFDENSRKYSDKSNKLVSYMAGFWSITDFIIGIQFAVTAIIGVSLALNGTITVGAYTAFLQYVALIVFPMRQLGRVVGDLGKTTVALDRIDEMMNVVSEYEEDTENEPEIKGDVEFENVSFKFDDESNMTINDVSFKVKAGETVAIVGKTGCGKSTLINLMVRLLDYHSGTIKYNGIDIKTMNKKWVRKNVGIILQEPYLYSKTIYENISIMNKKSSQDAVFKVAEIASIHEDIQGFEKGYETMVGERGVTLSGGQKQRVAIARMLLDDKPIIIFDDSLSAVDTETDLRIRTALSKYWENTTVFIVTHRITTAMEADQIIVLDKGSVAAVGKHDDLIKKDGLYKVLWDIQSKLESDFDEELERGGL